MIDIDYLIENINIVEYISSFVELEKNPNGEYIGISPFSGRDINPSFTITPETKLWFDFSEGIGGNILNFIVRYNKVGFKEALDIACKYLGEDLNNLPEKLSATIVIKKFKNVNKYEDKFFVPIQLKKDVMSQYKKTLITDWINEGISSEILDKYEVRIDEKNNKICFPIWSNEGVIIAICGRTLDKNYKEKKIPKYIYYNKINCLNFMWGYWQNREEIENKQEILIFEGCKSVMLAETWGYKNCVSSSTSRLSSEQIKEIVKVKCRDVVICFDKDVSLVQIKDRVGILTKFKNVYAVVDKWGLLEDKDSPVDSGQNNFEYLYENRIRIK